MKNLKLLRKRMATWGTIVVLTAVLSACTSSAAPDSIEHMHGLAFSNYGKEVWIPAHEGIVVYREGKWSNAPGEQHDYMGFSNTSNGFYSSGHPASGSDLPNPLGLIKSTDGGKTIETLALSGEVDFHGLTAGYRSHTLYVFNSSPNALMPTPGFYSSTDEAETWKQSAFKGVTGQPVAFAADPDDAGTVSVATDQGLFQSRDFGNTFEKLTFDLRIAAINYAVSGELLVSSLDGKLMMQSEEGWTEIVLSNKRPEEIITYMAQNPMDSKVWVVATEQLNLWLSRDQGRSWTALASQGKLQ
ncbi:hypothetical protein B1A99_24545 [Cohnella sp. CIP 111063]|uniref:F510_1955 family glycosylhydrolase n=1 Tax=unclassified Cohnella TaxID=2636738 RepID=UPI000B8BCCFD|nr:MULTISPECIES: hypothetical protein [unclassified Cohnella]OXS54954.1 hypothetical protein B1A99_24545 [Cohnella sp. CIP 111063]PRX65096.1 hypothetical protein B0G52_11846 [Cohnella sp. SGD-V74]